jgi:hypothetical protein
VVVTNTIPQDKNMMECDKIQVRTPLAPYHFTSGRQSQNYCSLVDVDPVGIWKSQVLGKKEKIKEIIF